MKIGVYYVCKQQMMFVINKQSLVIFFLVERVLFLGN